LDGVVYTWDVDRRFFMASHIRTDKALDALIDEVVKLGRFRSKEEAVDAALREYVQRQEQASILELAGTIEYGDGDGHKKLRSRKIR
jgi:Arc/MetJ-type ribon-helix-helix transcriptional regulator